MKPREERQRLRPLIESSVKECFSRLLQCEVCSVEWQLLESLDVVITVERPYSITEKMLLERQPETAHGLGQTINGLVRGELFLRLAQKKALAITDIFVLQNAETANRLTLFMLFDQRPPLHGHSEAYISTQQRSERSNH